MRKLVFFILLAAVATPTFAVGPSAVAAPDRSLWPDPIDNAASFDRASRAEILTFGHELAASESLDQAQLLDLLKVKEVDRVSVDAIRAKYWSRLASGYALASAHCAPAEPFCPAAKDEAAFRAAAIAFKGPADNRYDAWYANATAFHHVYLDELLRLAALFPRISSEVDTFSAAELSGNEPADRHFLLTFDDGPTRAGGNTDKTLDMLSQNHLKATFFMLGGNLEARLKQTPTASLAQAYAGVCVAAHGWEHKSHSAWPEWQDSVTHTSALVKDTFPSSYVPLFRPPYGQRKSDSATFFAEQHITVALWNIDSQDWNNKVDADQVKQRVLALMLLWRHGVILFHDIHAKAQVAVPWIIQQSRTSGITWMDCRGWTGP